MPHSAKAFMGPVLLVLMATTLALLWGLSWAAGNYPDCGQMTHSLGDAGWVVGGILLAAVIGITIPVILAVRGRFLLVVPVRPDGGSGRARGRGRRGRFAAGQAGCEVWGSIADAGEAMVFGLAVGAAPTLLIVGAVVGSPVAVPSTCVSVTTYPALAPMGDEPKPAAESKCGKGLHGRRRTPPGRLALDPLTGARRIGAVRAGRNRCDG